ncbi:glycosyltransferase involved in cell wall biosynthesis [Winogradskyella epiphytica]|uniref:Glycosyltransferase involved in cell wall biosynthesis n=1 Tax=Winogradskyella epiphytica TaxID=262005 RepID=A0A2V4WTW9_9FLAO|nr:glycosyltransferase family 2 protein [Winogradskyella epiphytica]PYE80116.1 glycosyltransferase involved in cell wall biosynthesis [Winogradskyella epiphytica]GGW71536.1 glycosyl transferase [Winogradskyella epiphytica]
MPFFSVIIPLYNKADYISDCLNSVLNQNFNDYEIIIVNDGSTDKSAAIVEGFESEKINLFHQKNSGVSEARNQASKWAKGIFLAFLDADDLWKPNHLQALKESIECFPDAGLYGNNYEINYNNDYIKPARFNFKYSDHPCIIDDFFKASLKDTVIWTSAAAIQREKFLASGMFNSIYSTGQDLDLWIRIALSQAIVFNPRITMRYNKSITDSLSKSEINDVRFALLSSYQSLEINNASLKHYLDLKRYGLALRTKINGETNIYKATLKTLNFKNLNFKQKALLKLPAWVLRLLNKIRPFLINNTLYLKLFKA